MSAKFFTNQRVRSPDGTATIIDVIPSVDGSWDYIYRRTTQKNRAQENGMNHYRISVTAWHGADVYRMAATCHYNVIANNTLAAGALAGHAAAVT